MRQNTSSQTLLKTEYFLGTVWKICNKKTNSTYYRLWCSLHQAVSAFWLGRQANPIDQPHVSRINR